LPQTSKFPFFVDQAIVSALSCLASCTISLHLAFPSLLENNQVISETPTTLSFELFDVKIFLTFSPEIFNVCQEKEVLPPSLSKVILCCATLPQIANVLF